jgi:hypothetical protein
VYYCELCGKKNVVKNKLLRFKKHTLRIEVWFFLLVFLFQKVRSMVQYKAVSAMAKETGLTTRCRYQLLSANHLAVRK